MASISFRKGRQRKRTCLAFVSSVSFVSILRRYMQFEGAIARKGYRVLVVDRATFPMTGFAPYLLVSCSSLACRTTHNQKTLAVIDVLAEHDGHAVDIAHRKLSNAIRLIRRRHSHDRTATDYFSVVRVDIL